ncbi:hypothetical protein BX070DRAFT_221800, partial [Coemansia spiralis]
MADPTAAPAVAPTDVAAPAPAAAPPKNPRSALFVRVAVWSVAAMQTVVAVLTAVFTCTWIGGFTYNAQVARHAFTVPWLVLTAYCLKPGNAFEKHFKFPDNHSLTFLIITILYIVVMSSSFSDDLLPLLYKGGAGIDYNKAAGTRQPPKIKPRQLYVVLIVMNTLTGVFGIGLFAYAWVIMPS